MAYLSRARLEGMGESAAAVEEVLARAARVLGSEIGARQDSFGYLDDEQVIETVKEEPEGPTRFRGRRVVFFDLSKQTVRAPTPTFHTEA